VTLIINQSVKSAALIILGGADEGSTLIVGPEHGRTQTISPMEHLLDNVHEVAGTGTLFPDEEGNPSLHLHITCGREKSTITGCIRKGVKVWHIIRRGLVPETILFLCVIPVVVGNKTTRISHKKRIGPAPGTILFLCAILVVVGKKTTGISHIIYKDWR